MHSEHLQNVRPGILIASWLIAVAVTSLIMLALLGLNLIDADTTSTRATMAAMAFGFFTGGVFAGMRALKAPILYGIGIGLLSLIIWFALSVLSSLLVADDAWRGLGANLSVTSILIQIITAVLGARMGYRWAVRGES